MSHVSMSGAIYSFDQRAHSQNHLTSLQCHLTGSQNHLTGLQCHLTGSQNHLTSLQCHLTGSQNHLTSLQCHLTGQQSHLTSLQCHLTGSQNHLTSQQNHLTDLHSHLIRIHNRMRRKRRHPMHNHSRIGSHYYPSDDKRNNLKSKLSASPGDFSELIREMIMCSKDLNITDLYFRCRDLVSRIVVVTLTFAQFQILQQG